ncbi:hypothetical protein [Streptomyces goshikiensis]
MGAAEWLSAVAAVGSVVTAGGAWKVAIQARDTAESAARTSEAAAQIERDRQHHEFKPKFEVRLVQQNPSPTSRATLTITWVGPSTLENLTEVSVYVRDDGRTRIPSFTPDIEPSAEQILQTVWSPYRIQPGISGGSADGRQATHVNLDLGDEVVLSLEPTPRPSWMTQDDWNFQQGGQPVRLRIEAAHPQYRKWQQVYTVPVEQPWLAQP